MIVRNFIIRTYQKSIKYLLEQKINTPAQHTLLAKVMGYDFEIQYKKRQSNKEIDALSRVQSSEVTISVLTLLDDDLFKNIKTSWRKIMHCNKLL